MASRRSCVCLFSRYLCPQRSQVQISLTYAATATNVSVCRRPENLPHTYTYRHLHTLVAAVVACYFAQRPRTRVRTNRYTYILLGHATCSFSRNAASVSFHSLPSYHVHLCCVMRACLRLQILYCRMHISALLTGAMAALLVAAIMQPGASTSLRGSDQATVKARLFVCGM